MTTPTSLPLGAFSLSLAVKDLAASTAFYKTLGFTVYAGDPSGHMVILRNGDATVGLFKGLFERNMLTFNPGWNAECQRLDSFVDVREIQRRLREAGVTFVTTADESTRGPASFVVLDPDGNPVLVDQHV